MPKTDAISMPVGPELANLAAPYFLPRGVAPPDRGALPLSGLTVLLVEDSRFASDAMRLMCQRSGARLRRAETLEQAQAHLKTYRPDVVIVDLGLPDGRGDRLIRALSVGRQGSVVFGTSGDPDGRKTALAAGALGFFDKPLPGLAEFQRALLRHLPGRFAIVTEGGDDLIEADPLALQDDLAHAVDLMAIEPDQGQRTYLATFLGGLARGSKDTDLADAARALGNGGEALQHLRHIVKARLAGRQAL